MAVSIQKALGASWSCAQCGHPLGSTSSNWRPSAMSLEHEASTRWSEIGSWARQRRQQPAGGGPRELLPCLCQRLAVDVASATSSLPSFTCAARDHGPMGRIIMMLTVSV